MKSYKRLVITMVVCFTSCFLGLESRAAVTVGHVENSATGVFVSSLNAALAAGGVSVGFFAAAIPTSIEWANFATQSIATAYATLTNPIGAYQFKDVRSIGITPGTGFDWDFPANLGGTVNTINLTPPNPPQTGTKLFVMAFNNGTFANGFTLASEWSVVSASIWTIPNDNTGISLLLRDVDTAGEVLIGQDTGPAPSPGPADVNIKLAAPVPEPSTAILLGASMLGFFSLRRRSSHV